MRSSCKGVQAPLLLNNFTSQLQSLADTQCFSVADFTACREGFDALQVQQVGHHVIESSKNNAAVYGVIETDMIFSWREQAAAGFVLQAELNLQPDGIVIAACEATVCCADQWIFSH